MAGGNLEGDFTGRAKDSEDFRNQLMETTPERAKRKQKKKNTSRLSQSWTIVPEIPCSWKF
jgi:hypothetical protein